MSTVKQSDAGLDGEDEVDLTVPKFGGRLRTDGGSPGERADFLFGFFQSATRLIHIELAQGDHRQSARTSHFMGERGEIGDAGHRPLDDRELDSEGIGQWRIRSERLGPGGHLEVLLRPEFVRFDDAGDVMMSASQSSGEGDILAGGDQIPLIEKVDEDFSPLGGLGDRLIKFGDGLSIGAS